MAFPSRILPVAIALGLAATATIALLHQSGQESGQQVVAAVDVPHTVGEPTGRHPLPRPSPSRPYGVS